MLTPPYRNDREISDSSEKETALRRKMFLRTKPIFSAMNQKLKREHCLPATQKMTRTGSFVRFPSLGKSKIVSIFLTIPKKCGILWCHKK